MWVMCSVGWFGCVGGYVWVCLSVYVCLCLCMSVSVCLSLCLSMSVYVSACCFLLCLSVYVSVYVCLCLCLSVSVCVCRLPARPCMGLPVSVCDSLCLSLSATVSVWGQYVSVCNLTRLGILQMPTYDDFQGEDVAVILNSLVSLKIPVSKAMCDRLADKVLSPPQLKNFSKDELEIVLANFEVLQYKNSTVIANIKKELSTRGEEE
jgi:hypothetical protein